jgi:ribosomal protein L33|tara:strand:- start:121 stop:294 length:174 start_codon:yes stop_codon:yes gene_type:complete
MANKSYKIIKLESEEEPKHFYTTIKPTRGEKAHVKLRLRKYNPRAMKHMWYKEVKLK